ncbi:MAG TPA: TolC family protein, partial [Polyangiales bacterium]|nr:TolC family protein [Polyangiales bacterium]
MLGFLGASGVGFGQTLPIDAPDAATLPSGTALIAAPAAAASPASAHDPVPTPSVAALRVAQAAGTATPPASRALGEVLDEYVRDALRSNLTLQSQSLEVERNLALLDAARGRFFPELAFAARYTRAEGGREIDVPLGQILNPIY